MTLSHSWWFAPKNIFRISIALCILRVAIKIGVGLLIASPLLIGDGVHNIGDAGVLIAAYWVIWFMENTKGGVYGADNLPAIFQLGVATSMGVLAVWIAKESIVGLFGQAARSIDASSLLVIILAIATSVLISLSASSYQRHSGEPTLVTAGEEMRGDALIECSILAGFVGEYFFSAPWIEYIFGLVVVVLIGKTAWEMAVEAKNTLLQVSLGNTFEDGIRSLVSSTCGVGEIVKLETYPVLRAARIKVWVLTQGGAEANEDIKGALKDRIREYAAKQGYTKCRPDVFFDLPDKDWHRVAYALTDDGEHCFVADRLEEADLLRICAVEYGEVVSAEDVPAPKTTDELIVLMRTKHVHTYRAWEEDVETVEKLRAAGVTYIETPTIVPPQ